jgi:hypothetical protein
MLLRLSTAGVRLPLHQLDATVLHATFLVVVRRHRRKRSDTRGLQPLDFDSVLSGQGCHDRSRATAGEVHVVVVIADIVGVSDDVERQGGVLLEQRAISLSVGADSGLMSVLSVST